MMFKFYTCTLYIFIPFSVMAVSGDECQGDITIHSNIVSCLQMDPAKVEKN